MRVLHSSIISLSLISLLLLLFYYHYNYCYYYLLQLLLFYYYSYHLFVSLITYHYSYHYNYYYYSLSIVYYLFVIYYLLLIIYCLLFIICYLLLFIHYYCRYYYCHQYYLWGNQSYGPFKERKVALKSIMCFRKCKALLSELQRGFDEQLLTTIFSHATLGNSIVAIISGVVAQYAADLFGFMFVHLLLVCISEAIFQVTFAPRP